MIIEKMHDSLQFCFLYQNAKSHLLGMYNIEDIFFEKKENYIPNNKYNIFYDYFNIIRKSNKKDLEIEYLNNLKFYENDEGLEKLIKNKNYDFSNIKYEDYYLYINLCLYYYMNKAENKDLLILTFEQNYNLLLKVNFTNEQKLRILKFTCEEFIKSSLEKRNPAKLLLMPILPENNSYKIALNYCRKLISEITEKSKLYLPMIQLDNYILFNYYINSYSYTLSMEPVIITQKHLLSSYEEFIFIFKEGSKNNLITLACQNTPNDINAINEYGLFPKSLYCNSYSLTGYDYAGPIVIELLHQKDHSKKYKKTKKSPSPLYIYKKSTLIKIGVEYQDKKRENGIKGEASLLIEYFIRYQKKSLAQELKFNLSLGNIIKYTNYFTASNFESLYKAITQLKKNKITIIDKEKKLSCDHYDEKQIKIKNNDIKNKDKTENICENKNKINDLRIQNQEKYHLWEGKYFIYPDSIPYNLIPYNNKDYKIPKSDIDFVNKYKKEIEIGRKKHYQ